MQNTQGNLTNYYFQAAESLSMNGRALNDRAIEVSATPHSFPAVKEPPASR